MASKKKIIENLREAYRAWLNSRSGKAARAAGVVLSPATAGTSELVRAANKAAKYSGPTMANTMKKSDDYRASILAGLTTKLSHVDVIEELPMRQKVMNAWSKIASPSAYVGK